MTGLSPNPLSRSTAQDVALAGAAHTIICEDRDFADWRGGAEHALIWGVLTDTDDVRAAVESARAHWADVLLERYARQPHITLGYGGPAPKPGATPQDPPYTAERLRADRAAIEELGLSPFEVRIGGWDTFQMVPYLRAEAPELHAAAGALGNEPRRPYVPHVTIGLYSVSVPLKVVADRADRWESPSIVVPVTRLSLLSYEAADVAGPLTEVDSIDLTRPARTPPGTRSG